ncbi:MAG TPA: tetratricopeptide repeat protein [Burkholderiaceae bacterium]
MKQKNIIKPAGGRSVPALALKTAQLLQTAVAKHQCGQVSEAEAIYERILQIDAKQFDALQLLGLIKRSKGEVQHAYELLALAASVNPTNVTIHATLGNALLDLQRYAEALTSYDRFLSVTPDFAEVLNNKANALSALGREVEAMACYEQALQKQADFPDAYFNRGNLHMDMRHYGQALIDYEQVLRIDANHYQAWNNRGNALQKLERFPEALQSYLRGLGIAPLNPELHASVGNFYKLTGRMNEAVAHFAKVLELAARGFVRENAALQLAILHHVYGNPEQCGPLLQMAKGIANNPAVKDQGSLIYCAFMLKLQLWWQAFRQQARMPQATSTMYVIGESHMLSAANLVVPYRGQNRLCKGLWIEGCTQWRLGSAGDNHYKQLLAHFLQAIPEGASVLLAIGEIDCRIDGGILKASKKSVEMSLEQRVEATVTAYLHHVEEQARRRSQHLIVSGVPAYNIAENGRTAEEMQAFGQFLARFNGILKEQAFKRGMDFLDVHTLTADVGGKAIQRWHIDEHHLRPDGIAAAFAGHLIAA